MWSLILAHDHILSVFGHSYASSQTQSCSRFVREVRDLLIQMQGKKHTLGQGLVKRQAETVAGNTPKDWKHMVTTELNMQ